jgi:predicted Zn-dependent peptidase
MSFLGDGSVAELLKELERRGGTEHAITSSLDTTYTFTIPKGGDNEEFLYNLANRMVNGNSFSDDQLREEKEVVITENQMLADERASSMSMAVSRRAFGLPDVNDDIGGSAESVEGLTVADLLEFRQKNYVPANMHITVTGVSAYSGFKGIRDSFGTLPPAPPPPRPPIGPEYQGGALHVDNGAILKQSYIATAFPLPDEPKDYVNDVLKNYLTMTIMDKLRGERERKVYCVLSSVQGQQGRGVMIFDTNTRPENAGAVLPAISNALKDLADGKVDKARFETAVAQVRSSLSETNEAVKFSPDSITNSFDNWRFFRTAKKDLKKVTPEDISAVAKNVMLARPPTLVTRGDTRNIQSYDQFVSMLNTAPVPQQAPVPVVA